MISIQGNPVKLAPAHLLWEICTLSEITLCNCVEERRLADVWKTDDTHLQVVGRPAQLGLLDGLSLLWRHLLFGL